MSNATPVTPIGAAYSARPRPLTVDDAVRAALSFRPPGARSFGNEDDVEGPRAQPPEAIAAIPTP